MEKKKFEDKIKELEKIINALENGENDLENSVEQFSQAMKLINECDTTLKTVEEQVNKIVLENNEEKDFEIEE